jgi:hypothetical protein
MYTQQNSKPALRELDRRASNGIIVTLLWNPEVGQVLVAVQDTFAGESFKFPVRGSEALAAFHHPYAYAPETVGSRGARPVNKATQPNLTPLGIRARWS